jgi:hypothetical protein
MSDPIDVLLGRLRAQAPGGDLSRLESGVWERVERQKRGDIFGNRPILAQVGVSCGALLVGLLMARFAGYDPMPRILHSEMVVLSDDSMLAPSVRLEGGI